MFATNEKIISLFEVSGMTPEQISETEELSLIAVKAALMQSSSSYRKMVKAGEPDLDYTSQEQQIAKNIILNLAQFAEDDNLRLRAATYIRDDAKGRLDVVKAMAGLNVNVNLFQEQLARANAALSTTAGMKLIAAPVNNTTPRRPVSTREPVIEMEPSFA
jgi:hypothetical protein